MRNDGGGGGSSGNGSGVDVGVGTGVGAAANVFAVATCPRLREIRAGRLGYTAGCRVRVRSSRKLLSRDKAMSILVMETDRRDGIGSYFSPLLVPRACTIGSRRISAVGNAACSPVRSSWLCTTLPTCDTFVFHARTTPISSPRALNSSRTTVVRGIPRFSNGKATRYRDVVAAKHSTNDGNCSAKTRLSQQLLGESV